MPKILIIEDDQDQALLYAKAFGLAGVEVVGADNGLDGLAKAKSERPDLVLLDVVLNRENGVEVLRKLKSDPELKKTPVVIFSNLTKKGLEEEVLTLGAIDFIEKANYTPTELVKEVLNTYQKISQA